MLGGRLAPPEVDLLQGYHYLLGPVAALVAVGVLILASRWAFGSSRRPSAPRQPAGPPDYGLLLPVATVRSREDASMLRELLAEAGIRGTVAPAASTRGRPATDFQLLVFPATAARARELLASSER